MKVATLPNPSYKTPGRAFLAPDQTIRRNRPTPTPQHESLRQYSHTNTVTPTRTPPAARTKGYNPHSPLDWGRENDGSPQKDPKKRKHGVAVFGQGRVSRRGVGGQGAGVALGEAQLVAGVLMFNGHS